MLLSIKGGKYWRIGLWTLLGTLALLWLVGTLSVVLQCQPLTAFWDLDLRLTRCWSTKRVIDINMALGGMHGGKFKLYLTTKAFIVITDVILSFMP
jgi:hypothetical protein